MAVGSCKRRAHCRMPLTASLRCDYDDIHIIFCPALQCSSTNRSEFEFYYGTHTGTHIYRHTPKVAHTHTHSERLRRAHTFATSANDVKMSFAGNERRHRRQKVEPQLEPEIGDQLSCRWAAAFGYQITLMHTHTQIHTETPRRDTHTHTHGQQLTALPCSKFAASSEQKAHKVRN